MKIQRILAVTAVILLCALCAGCSSPTGTEIRTTAPATVPPTVPPTSTAVITVVSTPSAVETLPPGQEVDVQVYKQRPDATIHLVYNGGMGEVFVQNVMMRVTLSNGRTVEQYLNDGTRRPRRGDELVMDGTRGTDQVAVFVTSAGRTFKIFDEPLANPYY